MVAAILLGIVGGFVLSIPPGPLAVAVSKQGLEGHFRPAFLIALAAAIMDVFYILIAAFASSAIIVALRDLVNSNGWFLLVFQILCVGVLLFLGIRYFRQKKPRPEEARFIRREEEQEQRARQMGHPTPFFIGLLIAVTNLATPTFIPSMIAFVGYLQANGLLSHDVGVKVLFSLGFGVGTSLWFVVFLRILIKHRAKFSTSMLDIIFKFAGATFILFAALITYNVIITTEWSTLL
ncbi:MAG: LysE family transporter [Ignavibacteriae bacterium]|nr:LysE family transporter [Ignavibacteriota bacterium]